MLIEGFRATFLSLGLPLGKRNRALGHPEGIFLSECCRNNILCSGNMLMYLLVNFRWSLQRQQNGNCNCTGLPERSSLYICTLKNHNSQAALGLEAVSEWAVCAVHTVFMAQDLPLKMSTFVVVARKVRVHQAAFVELSAVLGLWCVLSWWAPEQKRVLYVSFLGCIFSISENSGVRYLNTNINHFGKQCQHCQYYFLRVDSVMRCGKPTLGLLFFLSQRQAQVLGPGSVSGRRFWVCLFPAALTWIWCYLLLSVMTWKQPD